MWSKEEVNIVFTENNLKVCYQQRREKLPQGQPILQAPSSILWDKLTEWAIIEKCSIEKFSIEGCSLVN